MPFTLGPQDRTYLDIEVSMDTALQNTPNSLVLKEAAKLFISKSDLPVPVLI